MPEIGEVARVVHYLRKHLVGRKIASCIAHTDDIVYGKVGCSAEAFQSAVTNRTVVDADQQGKYFYMTFDKPPHAVMHLGMTGWMKFDAEDTHYYKKAKEKDGSEAAEWPPKYAKFILRCEKGKIKGQERPAVECAFVDARRLARIRLVDCDAANIRNESPLKENGPDPVRDKDTVTVEWLTSLLRRKKVPVKALLLDQANISGVGNWVADEVLYQGRIHPEQYSNTFSDSQIKDLHQALMDVTGIAVSTLSDSTQFPEDWLMKYRWDKGKKDSNVLPNGEKIVHLKVGGRTSAIVPSRQKKTGAVAGDIDDAELEEDEKEDEDEDDAEEKKATVKKSAAKAKPSKRKAEPAETGNTTGQSAKKGRAPAKQTSNQGRDGVKMKADDETPAKKRKTSTKKETSAPKDPAATNRRRSARVKSS